MSDRNKIEGLFARFIFTPSQFLIGSLLLITLSSPPAFACSRLLWNSTDNQVIVGRTMDWAFPFENNLYITPRGATINGGTKINPLSWTVKYGSVTSSISNWLVKQGPFTLDDGAADGINEKGFAAHFLFLSGSRYEKRDPSIPAVSTSRWVRYLLDNFATVEEALAGMDHIQIVHAQIGDHPLDFHVAIEDKSGDSAIIEFVNGKQVIHHGRNYTVMTNNPPYDEQIKELKQYKPFGGQKILPGDIESNQRFARLSYFSRYLPQTKKPEKAVAQVFSVMRTVISPIGAPYQNGAAYPTWWVSVSDLKNGVYHYDFIETPNTIHVNVKSIDFSKGSGIRWLNPRRLDISGLVNDQFKPIAPIAQ